MFIILGMPLVMFQDFEAEIPYKQLLEYPELNTLCDIIVIIIMTRHTKYT